MKEPRTFRARMVMAEVGRPLSVAELAPLIPATRKQTHAAVESLVMRDLARRVTAKRPIRYEALA